MCAHVCESGSRGSLSDTRRHILGVAGLAVFAVHLCLQCGDKPSSCLLYCPWLPHFTQISPTHGSAHFTKERQGHKRQTPHKLTLTDQQMPGDNNYITRNTRQKNMHKECRVFKVFISIYQYLKRTVRQ